MSKTILIKAKKDIIDRVAEDAGLTKKDATAAVEAVFQEITDTLVDGGKISVYGFGQFEAVEKPAHQARNPRSGEMIDVPASRSVKFKASKSLKDAVK